MSDLKRYDVLIIGGGFSGSILARVLSAGGRRVALVDSGRHPRFAIGESSTPLADAILRYLGVHYRVPEFIDLASYGRWKRTRPELSCGLKRGFSYYRHRPGETFTDDIDASSSLLVAASRSDEFGDTHWYRADVDQFLYQLAAAAGVETFSQRTVVSVDPGGMPTVILDDGQKLECELLVDASGKSAVTARLCGSKRLPTTTNSASQFGHYRGVRSWAAVMQQGEISVGSDPFACDASAQHHLLADGWLWMLRFDNSITSVGWTASPLVIQQAIQDVGDCDRRSVPAAVIRNLTRRYPSVHAMLADATPVDVGHGGHVDGRLQQQFSPLISERCVMLPTTAATIDPLHSTGIAHALSGVLRIAAIVLDHPAGRRGVALASYAAAVEREVRLIDQLIATAYAVADDFQRFSAACMLYFVAVIRSEERFLGRGPLESYFGAHDAMLVQALETGCQILRSDEPTPQATARIRGLIAPWNTAGLFDKRSKNRYAYTATKP